MAYLDEVKNTAPAPVGTALERAVFNAFADWRDETLTVNEVRDIISALEDRGVFLSYLE